MPGLETVFENTFPVAETTLGSRNAIDSAGREIQQIDILANVFQFDAVGTDVLNRCGAGQSRNQRQVLQTADPGLQRILHQIMPILTGADVEMPGITIFPDVDTL